MSNNNLPLSLQTRIDKEGKTFYVAKVRAPITIDCTEGVVFLVFTSEKGKEQLQIGLMDE